MDVFNAPNIKEEPPSARKELTNVTIRSKEWASEDPDRAYCACGLIGTDIPFKMLTTTRCSLFSSRTVSIVILLALSLTCGNAKSQDHSGPHSVYPLSKFQPGQWVENVSGDFTSEISDTCITSRRAATRGM